MRRALLAGLLALALSGCVAPAMVPPTAPSAPSSAHDALPCADAQESERALASAESWLGGLASTRFSMSNHQVWNGGSADGFVASDPEHDRFILGGAFGLTRVNMRIDGARYSVAGNVTVNGRDEEPHGLYPLAAHPIVGGIVEDLTVADAAIVYAPTPLTVRCDTGPQGDTLTVGREAPNGSVEFTVLRADDTLLALHHTRPADRLNESYTFNTTPFSVAFDPDMPLTPVVAYAANWTEDDAAGTVAFTLAPGGEWVPLADLDIRSLRDGVVVDDARLEQGNATIKGLRFEYDDNDHDGLLSPGDAMQATIDPGYDFIGYDRWAGHTFSFHRVH